MYTAANAEQRYRSRDRTGNWQRADDEDFKVILVFKYEIETAHDRPKKHSHSGKSLRRPLPYPAQGSAACGVVRPFSPGATSSWTGAESSLARSRPPPAPLVRVATPVLTSRNTTPSKLSPPRPDAVFTPVRGGRTGISTSGFSFSVDVWGCTCWLGC